MKRLWILLCVLLLLTGCAVPEKTHVFQSGGVIRASELNQNFDDFFNALTDGTADLTVDTVSANSITGTSYLYTSTKTITKVISCVAFNPITTNATSYYNYEAAATIYGLYAATGTYKALAPIYLPDNAIVTILQVSADATVTVTLNRQTLNSSTVVEMATAVGGTSDTSITSGTIDADSYTYWLTSGASATSAKIYTVSITYTLTQL